MKELLTMGGMSLAVIGVAAVIWSQYLADPVQGDFLLKLATGTVALLGVIFAVRNYQFGIDTNLKTKAELAEIEARRADSELPISLGVKSRGIKLVHGDGKEAQYLVIYLENVGQQEIKVDQVAIHLHGCPHPSSKGFMMFYEHEVVESAIPRVVAPGGQLELAACRSGSFHIFASYSSTRQAKVLGYEGSIYHTEQGVELKEAGELNPDAIETLQRIENNVGRKFNYRDPGARETQALKEISDHLKKTNNELGKLASTANTLATARRRS